MSNKFSYRVEWYIPSSLLTIVCICRKLHKILFLLTISKMGCIKSKQKLSQEELDFLKTNTCYDEKTIQVWYRTFMQDCPNGRMTQKFFVKKHEKFFSGDFCQNFFKTFDTCDKGYLNFREYVLASINMTYAGVTENKHKVSYECLALIAGMENLLLSFDRMTNIDLKMQKVMDINANMGNSLKKNSRTFNFDGSYGELCFDANETS